MPELVACYDDLWGLYFVYPDSYFFCYLIPYVPYYEN